MRKYPHEELQALLADAQPYAAPRRQFLEEWVADFQPRSGRRAKADLSKALPEGEAQQPATTSAEKERHFSKFRADQARQESFSVASEESKPDYFIKTRLVERIEIENFKPIERLVLQFPSGIETSVGASTTRIEAPLTSHCPWLMLLGENGAGKSSVLQAVALCLLGNDWRRRVRLDARRFVRQGANEGSVRVFLTGSTTPIELTFSSASPDFESFPGEPKMLLLGYGSTRLLPRPGVAVEGQHDFAQTDNLFNPFVALGDATSWLAQLDSDAFNNIARALKILLQLGDEDQLVRVSGPSGITVEADVMGTQVPLEELSDGYQSVLALTCDIMRVLLSRWESMDIAEGFVLLDEIGSHLHPRWRMRVVRSMREIFPRVQFLASTHDPLCLRGLDDGEVAVMRRDNDNRVTALTDELPGIRGLRVDQLLTSEFFGLNSTVDPHLERLFEEYYGLLAAPLPTAKQAGRIAELRAALDRYRVLGNNRRERMMLDVIDQYLAREPDIPNDEFRRRLTDSTKRRLRAIWEGTETAEIQALVTVEPPPEPMGTGEPA